MNKKLNYVFDVAILSCSGSGEWIHRCRVLQSNECRSSERVLAGNIADHHLKLGDSGVQVKFLGLQEDLTKMGKKPQPKEAPITPMNPFTLTLIRD